MHVHFGMPTSNHTVTIVCPKCGRSGAITWDDVAGAAGPRQELADISGGFHERLARKAPHDIELVCNGCGTVQQDNEPLPQGRL